MVVDERGTSAAAATAVVITKALAVAALPPAQELTNDPRSVLHRTDDPTPGRFGQRTFSLHGVHDYIDAGHLKESLHNDMTP